jgi:hypothetical protein
MCAICGKKQTADEMVYSRFTRNHYCVLAAEKQCRQRAMRRKKKKETA